MYLRLKRFCASSEDNRMRPSPVSKSGGDRNSSVGVAKTQERLGREDSGPVMSLDLTGEPFPATMDSAVRQFLCDLQDPEVYGHAVTQEVRDRARKLLGASPLCAVRERAE